MHHTHAPTETELTEEAIQAACKRMVEVEYVDTDGKKVGHDQVTTINVTWDGRCGYQFIEELEELVRLVKEEFRERGLEH